ncbi:MAG: cellulase family glycosylhydrolase [Breznakibacter sp.]
MKKTIFAVTILLLFSLTCCEKEDKTNTLTVSTHQIAIPEEGGNAVFSIATNAASWEIDNPAPEWLTLPAVAGIKQEITISLNVTSKTLEPRTATLTIKAGNAKPLQITVTQAASAYLYSITANTDKLDFAKSGNETLLQISTDAPGWALHASADWIQTSSTTGEKGTSTVNVTAPENSDAKRTAILTITAEHAPSIEIKISQDGNRYPNYNTSPVEPDATGMTGTATELASKIKVGWNIGNTLEAIGGETAWGNPMVTDELIKLVKQNGFNAIRIPCAWNQYMENNTTAKIRASWLNRVKQVVQYCVDNDMYVILNIHWDGGWLENNCTPEKKDENNDKQRAFWEQIATHLRDFDERLIFAGTNEPNVENASQMAVLQSYLQTFVDAVRSTGGRNSYRVLAVQGPSTDIEKTDKLMGTLPTNVVPNRMMVEIHYYTPYQFCLMTEDASWGKMFYYWGKDYHSTTQTNRNATWGEETQLNELMALMKTKFVDKGIPVIMGEYAVIRRTSLTGDALSLHLASRAHYLKYLTKQAKAHGILPFYWDAGNMGNNASALFDRKNNTAYDPQALNAIIEGANE